MTHTKLSRRTVLGTMAAVGSTLTAPGIGSARAQARSVTLAVGSSIINYVPAPMAAKLGYYKAEGLDVQTQDFQSGGSKALQALVGGSVDVVVGSYDHTISMQAQGKRIVGTVLLNTLPGVVFVVRKDLADKVRDGRDLKGLKVGVTTLGSSTDMFARYWAARSGLAPKDIQILAVGSGAPGMVALETKNVDVLGCYDPIATLIQQRDLGRVLVDSRTDDGANDIFGGSYPFACLYATAGYIEKNPETMQKLVNALMRTLDWLHATPPDQIVDALPAASRIEDRALSVEVVARSKPMFSTTGLFDPVSVTVPLNVLNSFDPKVKAASIDLSATYTNRFVERAVHS